MRGTSGSEGVTGARSSGGDNGVDGGMSGGGLLFSSTSVSVPRSPIHLEGLWMDAESLRSHRVRIVSSLELGVWTFLTSVNHENQSSLDFAERLIPGNLLSKKTTSWDFTGRWSLMSQTIQPSPSDSEYKYTQELLLRDSLPPRLGPVTRRRQ